MNLWPLAPLALLVVVAVPVLAVGWFGSYLGRW